MLTRVVSPDPEGAELAGHAFEGLEQLAKGLEEEGDTMMPWQARQYIRQLKLTPAADMHLSISIADCLEMLAERWQLIDRPEVAEIWRWRAGRIRERAMMRAIGRSMGLQPIPEAKEAGDAGTRRPSIRSGGGRQRRGSCSSPRCTSGKPTTAGRSDGAVDT